MSLEPIRAAIEYFSMQAFAPSDAVAGDGHPVIVFPGLASDRRTIEPLTSFCRKLGYAIHDWGRSFDAGPTGSIGPWLEQLTEDIDKIAASYDDSASLVGWSLGGIYAREVAKRMTGRVRQVITIGTPFAGAPIDTNAGLLYSLLSGKPIKFDRQLHETLRVAPAVPTTSIYSRTDGIVPWQACVQAGERLDIENIEVEGSHWGLGWTNAVLSVIADRLRQPEGAWRAYGQSHDSGSATALAS